MSSSTSKRTQPGSSRTEQIESSSAAARNRSRMPGLTYSETTSACIPARVRRPASATAARGGEREQGDTHAQADELTQDDAGPGVDAGREPEEGGQDHA